MHHLAIMKKEWGMLEKILSGKKTIESRWYSQRRAPWGRIAAGDTIYFKNAGEKVSAKADVVKVMQYDALDQEKVKAILQKYGRCIGIAASAAEFAERCVGRQYGILIFMANSQAVEPFAVHKKGFGNMASWITVKSIDKLAL